MGDNLEDLVSALTTTSETSDDVLSKLTNLLEEFDVKYLLNFISENFHSLYTLEHWAWKMLSKNSYQWLNQSNYFTLFQNLALFNKNLIFTSDEIDADQQASLLIPETTNIIDNIFEQIEKLNNENDLYFIIISLWFDNLSSFIHEHTQFIKSLIISNINNSIASKFVMTDQYKFYLRQLQQSHISQSILTNKHLFYIKTCSFSLSSYFFCKRQTFSFTGDEILRYFATDYLEIIHLHSSNVQSWSKELLSCITHLINFISTCCWWCGEKEKRVKILLSSEEISHNHIQSLIHIISYKPFHQQIQINQSNDETLLIHTVLSFLRGILEINNLICFIRRKTNLVDILLPLAETPGNNRINLGAYVMLGEILSDERLKELKITDNVCGYFFYKLEQAWKHPAHIFQRSSVQNLLRGFLILAKNDSVQQKTADANKVALLIEMCDQYPIVFDILWALSFNHDIQQQLRSNRKFMMNITHLKQEIDNEQMRKITHGILWNLERNHEDYTVSDNNIETMFDIMISYSHKDKIICKQIYDELIKNGYRVWIDFDQIHGNVMEAMAQAIERSNTILICMSEQYRRSNYCRAEAYYAFQRQLKIVPILLQNHYKPDGWLSFLVGQLLYIDFTKYEFPEAMKLLFKELKAPTSEENKIVHVESEHEMNSIALNLPLPLPLPGSISRVFSKNILEWNQTEVQDWLIEHNLVQMACLLSNYDGASLVHLNKYLTNGDIQPIIKLLVGDSLRLTNQNLSLVELARLPSLIDHEQQQITKSKNIKKRTKKTKRIRLNLCQIM